jgi:hypothetical protein
MIVYIIRADGHDMALCLLYRINCIDSANQCRQPYGVSVFELPTGEYIPGYVESGI